MRGVNGADDQTELEPASLVSLLDELEEWGGVLKAEPELIHKLRAFEAAASEVEERGSGHDTDTTLRRKPMRGPSI